MVNKWEESVSRVILSGLQTSPNFGNDDTIPEGTFQRGSGKYYKIPSFHLQALESA